MFALTEVKNQNNTQANSDNVDARDGDEEGRNNNNAAGAQLDRDDSDSDDDTIPPEGLIRNKCSKGFTELVQLIKQGKMHKIRSLASVEALQTFAEMCFPALVGKQQWKVNHHQVLYRSFMTCADEALGALILENNFEEWMVLSKGGTIDKTNRKTKYTHGGIDARGTKKGWSLDGRRRYNVIFDQIKKDRKEKYAEQMEEQLKIIWCGKNREGDLSIRDENDNNELTARDIQRMEEEFVPRYDFED